MVLLWLSIGSANMQQRQQIPIAAVFAWTVTTSQPRFQTGNVCSRSSRSLEGISMEVRKEINLSVRQRTLWGRQTSLEGILLWKEATSLEKTDFSRRKGKAEGRTDFFEADFSLERTSLQGHPCKEGNQRETETSLGTSLEGRLSWKNTFLWKGMNFCGADL